MRTVFAAALFILSTTAALANRCYWINGLPYCDAGCWVVQRWWDGNTQWMRYSCIPPFLTDPGFIVTAALAVGALVVVLVGAARTASLRKQTAEAEAQAIEAEEITDRLRAAAADADRFIETYRNR